VIALALAVAAGSLLAGTAAGLAIRRLPVQTAQLAALAVVAAALPLGAVVLAGLVMFHSHDDQLILAVTAAASTAAVLAALAVARSLARSLDSLRGAAARLAAGDLAMLVDDLFELARIDAGALTLELREARLRGLVDSCLRGLEPEASARGVRLEADVADIEVRCAPEKIERVLLNLVTNALRHTPSDGAVAVHAEPVDGEVRVSVEDTGEGFERARDEGGTGLGLAIARGLVEAHGGRIWAESPADGGARVFFTLPLA
jgi:signal transduction histidine kinase